jgi:hypothetical protein
VSSPFSAHLLPSTEPEVNEDGTSETCEKSVNSFFSIASFVFTGSSNISSSGIPAISSE